MLPDDRLLPLEPLLGMLMDVADVYDMDMLAFDAGCGIHGSTLVSDTECSCQGKRYSAVEFVEQLQLDVRSARADRENPAGQPNRRRNGETRVSLVASR